MVEEFDVERWRTISNIALRRFPELQRGESIGLREIKKRLNELKNYYYVKPLSGLTRDELWAYFGEVKQYIRNYVGEHSPQILEEINRLNLRQKKSALEIQ